MWHVYMVQCRDGSLYTGITTDIERRLKEHNSKTGSRYTRAHAPVKLVHSERVADRSRASKRESAIKRLSRAEKLILIKNKKHA